MAIVWCDLLKLSTNKVLWCNKCRCTRYAERVHFLFHPFVVQDGVDCAFPAVQASTCVSSCSSNLRRGSELAYQSPSLPPLSCSTVHLVVVVSTCCGRLGPPTASCTVGVHQDPRVCHENRTLSLAHEEQKLSSYLRGCVHVESYVFHRGAPSRLTTKLSHELPEDFHDTANDSLQCHTFLSSSTLIASHSPSFHDTQAQNSSSTIFGMSRLRHTYRLTDPMNRIRTHAIHHRASPDAYRNKFPTLKIPAYKSLLPLEASAFQSLHSETVETTLVAAPPKCSKYFIP